MASTLQTQDSPRPGGFPAIRYKRNIPKRGPSGLVILTGLTAISTLGFYWASQTIQELRCDSYRRTRASLQREAEIMKDVPDWKVGESVYNTKRYVPPSVFVLPEK
ncbi:1572_t:CDS:2 [Funneliformis caledonium]|uniref:NADH dehydrogenase [ubiquinone] 1 alpha subcomplex subunit 13 n=1 Tax=Funneliformis caledonium TaxID=1117310 RepID=A0A9N9NFP5_9GLOM|nr:1572_t:CDS:2 [Funneliformis caledonium]